MSGVAVSYLGMMHMTLRSAIILIVRRNTATFAHILFRCISLSSSKSYARINSRMTSSICSIALFAYLTLSILLIITSARMRRP